jgi:hypothetical protein
MQTRSAFSRGVRRTISLGMSKRNYVEDLGASSAAGLLELTQRRAWLLPAFIFGLVATMFVWIAALRFPYAASEILSNGFGSNLPSRYSTLLTARVFDSVRATLYLIFCIGPSAVSVTTGI